MICITHIRTYPIRTSHASKYSKWFYLLRGGLRLVVVHYSCDRYLPAFGITIIFP